jgi:hypothetical protein
MKKIALYYSNGITEFIETTNPEKAKRLYGAQSYIILQ